MPLIILLKMLQEVWRAVLQDSAVGYWADRVLRGLSSVDGTSETSSRFAPPLAGPFLRPWEKCCHMLRQKIAALQKFHTEVEPADVLGVVHHKQIRKDNTDIESCSPDTIILFTILIASQCLLQNKHCNKST